LGFHDVIRDDMFVTTNVRADMPARTRGATHSLATSASNDATTRVNKTKKTKHSKRAQ
jgi:hypothetical protein